MSRHLPLLLLATAAPAHADERSYMLSGFERIRVEGPFEVTVTSGGSPSAKAEGDARALDAITVRVDGRTLVVSAGINAWGGYPGAAKLPPRIAVGVPALRSAAVFGGGTLRVDRMAGQRVDLSLSGSGTLAVGAAVADRLDALLIGGGVLSVGGTAQQAWFQTNGAGSVDATELDVRALTVSSQGTGDSTFTARSTAEVSASGQGSVVVAGEASCVVRGSARVVCGRLQQP